MTGHRESYVETGLGDNVPKEKVRNYVRSLSLDQLSDYKAASGQLHEATNPFRISLPAAPLPTFPPPYHTTNILRALSTYLYTSRSLLLRWNLALLTVKYKEDHDQSMV